MLDIRVQFTKGRIAEFPNIMTFNDGVYDSGGGPLQSEGAVGALEDAWRSLCAHEAGEMINQDSGLVVPTVRSSIHSVCV